MTSRSNSARVRMYISLYCSMLWMSMSFLVMVPSQMLTMHRSVYAPVRW